MFTEDEKELETVSFLICSPDLLDFLQFRRNKLVFLGGHMTPHHIKWDSVVLIDIFNVFRVIFQTNLHFIYCSSNSS